MGNMKTAAAFAALAACIGGTAHLRRNIRMPVREYTRYALYMAALDDEICRNELEGKNIGGELILFPPKSESLQYRYHLFLQMNRRKSRAALQAEIAQRCLLCPPGRLPGTPRLFFPRAQNWCRTCFSGREDGVFSCPLPA